MTITPTRRVHTLTRRRYRKEGKDAHLMACDQLRATEMQISDGFWECDCPYGCEYVRFEAVMRCRHGHEDLFMWGQFGTSDLVLAEIAKGGKR
ncbi:hypothetical protein ACIBH1_45280 [Nonomuraea sp. NPDC050663]|uniref:hypothetical protein n=1 Tax=Nonomuraea sp. NPDC050663 TaxID=3364370 RepID=UPI0037972D59